MRPTEHEVLWLSRNFLTVGLAGDSLVAVLGRGAAPGAGRPLSSAPIRVPSLGPPGAVRSMLGAGSCPQPCDTATSSPCSVFSRFVSW